MLLINYILVALATSLFSNPSTQTENTPPPVAVEAVEESRDIIQYFNGNKKAEIAYKIFERELRETSLSSDEIDQILEAAAFAAKKHQGQTRLDSNKTPYIIHPIGVAHNLFQIGNVMDKDILIAALLHDTVEDTNTSFAEIQEKFGPDVEGYVREVTYDQTLAKEEREQFQIESAKEKSQGAASLLLADKLYNVLDVKKNDQAYLPLEKREHYAQFARKVVENLPEVNPQLKIAFDELYENPDHLNLTYLQAHSQLSEKQ